MADALGVDEANPTTYDAIISKYLTEWGLSSLTTLVNSLGKSGATQDSIALQIQDSNEYKTRFAGNDARLKAGLRVLSPAEYIGLEGQYKQVLRSYGMPAGFYDSQQSMADWIGKDVSASEVAARAKDASDAYVNAPPTARAAWDAYYGHAGAGGAIAGFLDPAVAQPLLDQHVLAAGIGGAAADQGVGVARTRAEELAAKGVTIQSARQAYSDIATRITGDNAIASRFGGTNSLKQEEDVALLGDATARQQQATQYASEQSQFAGHGGASAASNDVGNNY